MEKTLKLLANQGATFANAVSSLLLLLLLKLSIVNKNFNSIYRASLRHRHYVVRLVHQF